MTHVPASPDAPEPAALSLEEWTETLVHSLGLPDDLASLQVRQQVLDLARDAAHGVARPAAPITTFLAGVAAGRAGSGVGDLTVAAEAIRAHLPLKGDL